MADSERAQRHRNRMQRKKEVVDAAIARMGATTAEEAKHDKTQIILDSMNEFKKLMQENQPSGAHPAVDKKDVERLDTVLDEIHKLKAFLVNLQAKSQQEGFTREALLEEQRGI
ncbi:MAG: hypothetical protein AAB703_03900, partial [Pseudomonadota bacterium]